MQTQKNVQFMLTIPKANKDLLVKLAAETNLENPDARATAAGIGRRILCTHLDSLRESRQTDNYQTGGENERQTRGCLLKL